MQTLRYASLPALVALLVPAMLPATSQAVVLDFDGTTVADYQTAPYSEDGFTLTRETSTGHFDFFGPAACNLLSGVCTSNFLNVDDSSGFSMSGSFFSGGPSTIRLVLTSGGAFNLVSLDVLDAYAFFRQGSSSTAACGDGVVSPFCIIQSSAGGNRVLAQGTMSFEGAGWTGITWIQFYSNGGTVLGTTAAIDNINVIASSTPPPPVPEPGTLALLGLGLAGLGLGRRRRVS